MKFSKVTILGGVAAVALGGALVATRMPSDTSSLDIRLPYDNAGSVANGAGLYQEYCASCHGANLQGAANWKQRQPDGMMPAPPHDDSGHTWHHPDPLLFAITKHGSAAVIGPGYQSNMPGFGDQLSDQEILDVLGYIKSTWPDRVVTIHNDINTQAN